MKTSTRLRLHDVLDLNTFVCALSFIVLSVLALLVLAGLAENMGFVHRVMVSSFELFMITAIMQGLIGVVLLWVRLTAGPIPHAQHMAYSMQRTLIRLGVIKGWDRIAVLEHPVHTDLE